MKIQLKIVLSILVVSMAVTSIFVTVEATKQWEETSRNEEKHHIVLLNNTIPFLTQALWRFDVGAVESIFTALFQAKSVIRAEAFDDLNHRILGKEKKSDPGNNENDEGRITDIEEEPNLDRLLTDNGRIDRSSLFAKNKTMESISLSPTITRLAVKLINFENNTKVIGYVVMDYSTAHLKSSLMGMIARMSLNGLVFAAVLIFLLIILMRYLIIRPISRLAGAANTIAQGNFDLPVNIRQNDEIGFLSDQFDKMRIQVRQFTRNLQELVEERTQQVVAGKRKIQEILNRIEQGILIFGEDFKIEDEYSEFVSVFYRKKRHEIVGMSVVDFCFPDSSFTKDDKTRMESALHGTLGMSLVGWEMNRCHLPTECTITIDNQQKFITMEWTPWLDQNLHVEKMMISIRDITHSKMLEAKMETEKANHNKVVTILGEFIRHEPIQIKNVLAEIEGRLGQIVKMQKHHQVNFGELYMHLHTLKGNARTYQFKTIVELSHEAEDILRECKENNVSNLPALDNSLKLLNDDFTNYQRVFTSFFNSENDSFSQKSLIISVGKIIECIKAGMKDKGIHFKKLDFVDEILEWDRELVKYLNDILIHVINNSIDHGYLFPKERGVEIDDVSISIRCYVKDDHLILDIADEGSGFDIEFLRKKAEERKLLPGSEKELFKLLLEDDISSADQISSTSGRGVGLSAVKRYRASWVVLWSLKGTNRPEQGSR
ncbi:MAG: HAMP domain-containing protein [Oligoflexales bacterium]|nr:HAMP domain-containing protein [Oligoflexales bacterium]